MSYYPFVLSIGVAIGVIGFMDINVEIPGTSIQFPWLSATGIVIGLWGLSGWSLEPVTEEGGH